MYKENVWSVLIRLTLQDLSNISRFRSCNTIMFLELPKKISEDLYKASGSETSKSTLENLCAEQFCCSLWREKWRWYFYSNFDLEGSKVAYLFCCLGSLNCKSHLCRNFIHENHSLLPLSFEAVNIFPCVHWCIIYSGFVLVYQNIFYIALFLLLGFVSSHLIL